MCMAKGDRKIAPRLDEGIYNSERILERYENSDEEDEFQELKAREQCKIRSRLRKLKI